VDRQLEGKGVLVSILGNAVGNRMRWEVFRVPEPMEAAIQASVSRIRCNLVCALRDGDGREVSRNVRRWEYNYYTVYPVTKDRHGFAYSLSGWFVGPVWGTSSTLAEIEQQWPIDVSAEDLRRVVKTEAFLDEYTEK
jgi:hypothetical protein